MGMKLLEALAVAEKLEAVIEEARDLEVGEDIEVPPIKFKIHGRSYVWDGDRIKRVK